MAPGFRLRAGHFANSTVRSRTSTDVFSRGSRRPHSEIGFPLPAVVKSLAITDCESDRACSQNFRKLRSLPGGSVCAVNRGRLSLAAAAGGVFAAAFAAACGALDLGSDIIWSSGFERGDFADWATPADAGGAYTMTSDAEATEAGIQITSEEAHSGRFSAKLSSYANLADPGPVQGGAGVFRQEAYPEEAYYSVWYYLPQAYVTTTPWIILKFKGVVGLDAGNTPGYAELLDLSLESLPGGGMTLGLSDARHQYGSAPLPDPVPIVPIGEWFQVESFYRNESDATGELTVWLNGTKIYDLVRPTGPNPMVYFSPCSLVYDLVPPQAVLYIDDVAISYSRIGTASRIEVPR